MKSAFLQGTPLDRDVFVKLPKEISVDIVNQRMKKRAYGFCDASRGFYMKLLTPLIEIGCKKGVHDLALFL